jgi:hypothetical protein
VVALFGLAGRRYDLVQQILDGPPAKQTVEARSNASQATIDETYRDLVAAGVLQSTGTTYNLTTFGRVFAANLDHSVGVLDTLTDFQAVLSRLPAGAGIDRRLLDGAERVHTTDADQLAATIESVATVDPPAEIECYVQSVDSAFFAALRPLLVDTDAPVTLVVGTEDTATVDAAAEPREIAGLDRADIVEVPAERPYGVVVAGGHVAVSVQECGGQTLIVNDTAAAAVWASECIEQVAAGEGRQQS